MLTIKLLKNFTFNQKFSCSKNYIFTSPYCGAPCLESKRWTFSHGVAFGGSGTGDTRGQFTLCY